MYNDISNNDGYSSGGSRQGGGIRLANCGGVIHYNSIGANKAQYGKAIYMSGTSGVSIAHNTITNHDWVGTVGSVIKAAGGCESASLIHNTMSANQAQYAVSFEGSVNNTELHYNDISGNTLLSDTNYRIGVIYMLNSSSPTTITANYNNIFGNGPDYAVSAYNLDHGPVNFQFNYLGVTSQTEAEQRVWQDASAVTVDVSNALTSEEPSAGADTAQ